MKAPNSELVKVQLLKSYCLPILLYASEAVRPSCSNVHSLENCINRAMFRIFHAGGKECIDSIRQLVGLPSLSILIEKKNRSIIKVQWIHCKPLDSNKCQDYTASRIVKICPLVAKILHIVWWGILF